MEKHKDGRFTINRKEIEERKRRDKVYGPRATMFVGGHEAEDGFVTANEGEIL